MKVCLTCGTRYVATGWTCPSCHAAPVDREGIPAFGVPADGRNATDAVYLDQHIRLAESRHFWFRARLRLLQGMLRRYFPSARSLLDVGCGTGFVLQGLTRFDPSLILAGCDVRIDTLAIARHQLPGVMLFAADTAAIPYESEFEVVTALDVLEHIDEDGTAVRSLLKVTKPGGGLIVTVPQHPWLWSEVDDFSCHRRRYVRSDLETKVRAAGFQILHCTSFCALTLPLLAASRLPRRRQRPFDPSAELRVPSVINAALGTLLESERLLIKLGVSLPFGSSLMLVARRPATS